MVAHAAGPAEPWHRDPVAERELGDAGAELDDEADALVPGDERRGGLDGPVAASGVDVGVTEAGGLHVDAHLAELEAQHRHLLDVSGSPKA